MAYAAKQDLIDRIGETGVVTVFDTDGDGVLGATDDTKIEKALADATETIDAYVGARYSLPLTTTPDLLVALCCDLALYLGSVDAATATEESRRRYEDAISLLKDIARGTASLGLPAASTPVSSSGSARLVSTTTRQFTREKLSGL